MLRMVMLENEFRWAYPQERFERGFAEVGQVLAKNVALVAGEGGGQGYSLHCPHPGFAPALGSPEQLLLFVRIQEVLLPLGRGLAEDDGGFATHL